MPAILHQSGPGKTLLTDTVFWNTKHYTENAMLLYMTGLHSYRPKVYIHSMECVTE